MSPSALSILSSTNTKQAQHFAHELCFKQLSRNTALLSERVWVEANS